MKFACYLHIHAHAMCHMWLGWVDSVWATNSKRDYRFEAILLLRWCLHIHAHPICDMWLAWEDTVWATCSQRDYRFEAILLLSWMLISMVSHTIKVMHVSSALAIYLPLNLTINFILLLLISAGLHPCVPTWHKCPSLAACIPTITTCCMCNGVGIGVTFMIRTLHVHCDGQTDRKSLTPMS